MRTGVVICDTRMMLFHNSSSYGLVMFLMLINKSLEERH